MRYYVYKITNRITGKYYIGKRAAKDPHSDSYMGSGRLIKEAIKKHGAENFRKEVLDVFESDAEAASLEAELVTPMQVGDPNCYNLHEGGMGGFAHLNTGDEPHRERCRRAERRRKEIYGPLVNSTDNFATNPHYQREASDRARTPEAIQKRRDTFKKTRHQQGEKNSQFGTVCCVPRDAESAEGYQRFPKDAIPEGWVTTKVWREDRKRKSGGYGRRWYNDGDKNYFLSPDDELCSELVRGRLMAV